MNNTIIMNLKTSLNAGRGLLLVLALGAAQAQAGVVAVNGNVNFIVGWNLVGNGVEASIPIASNVYFNDPAKVTTVWKWVASGSTAGITYPAWAFYAPGQLDGGQAYAATKGYDFLTTINAGEGFWVNASADFVVPLPAGAAVQASSFMPAVTSPATAGGSHALPHGWSLIATGGNPTPSALDAALATSASTAPASGQVGTNLTTLWAWDAKAKQWYFWSPELVNKAGLAAYLSSRAYLDFASMVNVNTPTGTLSPATGFWVNMP